ATVPVITYAALATLLFAQSAFTAIALIVLVALTAIAPVYLVELVVGVVAIWLSRNYFFIMNSNYPKQRLKSITSLIQPSFTLCDKECYSSLNWKNKILVERNLSLNSNVMFNKSYSLKDKAYIIFTSGSTGTPKGILVSHEGILNVLEYQKQKFELSENSKVLHFLNPSFDAFLSELGTTLLSGACLVISHKAKENISLLKDLIQQESITHIFLPPAILGILEPSEKLNSLKVVITGGETISKNVVRKWLPHFKLLSAYGPTEATICSHLAVCKNEWDNYLGELLPQRKEKLVYLESEKAHELWLGGSGLAIEYIGNPSETFSKFIWVEGERWYRTGDLVISTIEGLKFLRRKDQQIKLYGNRLELGELEKVAQNLSEVLFACSFYFELENKNLLILVYHSTQEITYKVWRAYLNQYVSENLLPHEILFLKEPILNQNGKWDLKQVKEWVIQKVFISKSKYEDSLSNIQLELKLEKLKEFWQSPLSSLGISVEELNFEIS
ncbi:MAG: AMP-binding protein, partial [Leptospiraceae bacterium]|nr:AMP-binding protein [Leptospiraceae bacterium]